MNALLRSIRDCEQPHDETPMATKIYAALTDRDAKRALMAFQTIVDDDTGSGAFVPRALDRLAELVGSDLTTLSVCDLKRGKRDVFGRKAEAISAEDRATFDRYFRDHPLVKFHASHRRGPTQRITDCVEGQSFQRTALFCDYYRKLGVNYAMALPLWIDEANLVSIVFNRSVSDFRDSERALVDLLRTPLARFYRSIMIQEEACAGQSSLQGVAVSDGWHVARVEENGQLDDVTEAAARLLRRFFPDAPSGSGGRLPEPLANWLRQRSRNWGLDRPAVRPYVCVRSGVKLTIHFIADPLRWDRGRLFMRQEKRPEPKATDFDGLPLTFREREVIASVIAGKTNTEIGILLAISPRTVQKHLENIFDKLGVETRTAAAVHAMAALPAKAASDLDH
jgi:DNA-binding CsgD family transcriptional regulator